MNKYEKTLVLRALLLSDNISNKFRVYKGKDFVVVSKLGDSFPSGCWPTIWAIQVDSSGIKFFVRSCPNEYRPLRGINRVTIDSFLGHPDVSSKIKQLVIWNLDLFK